MMLPDWKIRKEILIEPFSEESLQPAGYDLRVGGEAYVNGEILDVKDAGGSYNTPPKDLRLGSDSREDQASG